CQPGESLSCLKGKLCPDRPAGMICQINLVSLRLPFSLCFQFINMCFRIPGTCAFFFIDKIHLTPGKVYTVYFPAFFSGDIVSPYLNAGIPWQKICSCLFFRQYPAGQGHSNKHCAKYCLFHIYHFTFPHRCFSSLYGSALSEFVTVSVLSVCPLSSSVMEPPLICRYASPDFTVPVDLPSSGSALAISSLLPGRKLPP